ncbi:MAG: hypothetical protein ACE5KT_10465 [Methanosarcinales archaeon]
MELPEFLNGKIPSLGNLGITRVLNGNIPSLGNLGIIRIYENIARHITRE